jgi:hypothetical protein
MNYSEDLDKSHFRIKKTLKFRTLKLDQSRVVQKES